MESELGWRANWSTTLLSQDVCISKLCRMMTVDLRSESGVANTLMCPAQAVQEMALQPRPTLVPWKELPQGMN